MSAKNVKNLSQSPLGFPRGPTIRPGETGRVENWEKVESNTVVQSWVRAKAIEVTDAPARDGSPETQNTTGGKSQGTGGDNGGGEKKLEDMTNAELAQYIEDRGGDVKSNSTKAQLLEQAKLLPVEKK